MGSAQQQRPEEKAGTQGPSQLFELIQEGNARARRERVDGLTAVIPGRRRCTDEVRPSVDSCGRNS